MKTTLRLATCIALLSCGACERPKPSGFAASSVGPTSAAACPLGVEGAELEVADVPGGVDLTLRAAPERVDELRLRARSAAALHGAGAHEGPGHDGQHKGRQRHGLMLRSLPPSETRVDDIDQGVRIHVSAIVADQVDGLREQARERVDSVNRAPCTD